MGREQRDPATAVYRDHGLYVGFVDEVADPVKQGRVRVRIPGVLDPAVWAETVMPGSPFSNGAFAVPAVGSQVIVGFMQGELDAPVVLGGIAPPVGSEGYRAATEQETLPDLVTWENEDFMVVLGKRDTDTPYITICTRDSPQVSITLDIDQRAIEIKGPTSVALKSDGLISLQAPLIRLGNRIVQQNGTPV